MLPRTFSRPVARRKPISTTAVQRCCPLRAVDQQWLFAGLQNMNLKGQSSPCWAAH